MKRKERGFTLIEIIVVILMIGILAAIAVPIYTGYLYKARASEGITTLGAVKTFMLERRVSTGLWPDKTALFKEFNNFNDLYYFSSTEDNIIVLENDDNISITLTAATQFGLPTDFSDPTMTIHISFQGEEGESGWSGGIVTEYAGHLPPYSP